MFVRRESFKEYTRLYPVTTGIIAINIVMMLVLELYGSSTDVYTLLRFGAMFGLEGYEPEWWRYFTAMWLHIGWTHLLFNCFGLLVFTAPLERMLGSMRYAAYYVFCGVVGSAVSSLLHQDEYIGAGASGAIYGVYAAYLYIAVFHKEFMDYSSRKTIQIIVAIGFVHSLIVQGVDLWAHLGGFLAGVAATWLIISWNKHRR